MGETSFRLPKPEQQPAGHDPSYLLFRLLKWANQSALAFASEATYQEPLDGHGISYFRELVNDYRSLTKKRTNQAAEDTIQEILNRAQQAQDLASKIELAKTEGQKSGAGT